MSGILALITMLGLGLPDLSIDVGRGPVHCAVAPGEFEVLTLAIENDKASRVLTSLEVIAAGGETIPHRLYRTAISDDFFPGTAAVPDAVVGCTEVQFPPDATESILVVVQIPESMPPGPNRVRIRATFDGEVQVHCDLSLQIYDFVLPPVPSLPVLFDLDLESLSRIFDLPFDDLDSWTPIYDSLLDLRIAYRVWFNPSPDGVAVELESLRAHMNYVAATNPSAVVDVGGAPGFFGKVALPTPLDPQDRVQLYLGELSRDLRPFHAGGLLVAQPARFGAREQWHGIRQNYARFERADSRIVRILASPLHPHFERYTDIWALPESTPRDLTQLIATGRSLIRYDQSAVERSIGSAGGLDHSGIYQTLASESVDGSEATAWIPQRPSQGESPWLEITLRDGYPLETIAIVGRGPRNWDDVVVETAFNPGDFARATVSWSSSSRNSESGWPVQIGTLRYPRECRGLRLQFPRSRDTETLEIAELLFNNPDLHTVESVLQPRVPWLDASLPESARGWQLGPEEFSEGPRAIPWRCWVGAFEGLLGPTLNAPHDDGGAPLVGVGRGQLLPTRRLFALRDGLEDVEYLKLFWGRIARNELTRPAGFSPGTTVEFLSETTLGNSARREAREKMGKLLSGGSVVTRNFGP